MQFQIDMNIPRYYSWTTVSIFVPNYDTRNYHVKTKFIDLATWPPPQGRFAIIGTEGVRQIYAVLLLRSRVLLVCRQETRLACQNTAMYACI